MVTNINLVAPESENKSPLTGKSALTFSILLIVVVFLAYGAILYFGNSYSKQNSEVQRSITQEKAKMAGQTYSDLYDFQERLILLDKVTNDHAYWDRFFRDFSRYFIPEVRLTDFSFDEKEGILDVKGIAANFEMLSREVILLKSYPGSESVEFKNSSEKTSGENGQGGVEFDVTVKLNDSVLKK
ncbi:MAG: PilN domain-containing protein [Parcubacteria group bacterium]|jgi:hypothetical protein